MNKQTLSILKSNTESIKSLESSNDDLLAMIKMQETSIKLQNNAIKLLHYRVIKLESDSTETAKRLMELEGGKVDLYPIST